MPSYGIKTAADIHASYAAVKNGERGSKLALTILERLLLGLPGHVMMA